MEKHIIWTAYQNFEDWEDDLREEYPDASEDTLYTIMLETNRDYLDDERSNLSDICIPNGICAVGVVETWQGRFTGIPKEAPVSVPDCLRSFCDSESYITFYVDEKGEFRVKEAHHDGTNCYWFRAFKPGVSEEQKERLQGLILSNLPYEKYLRRITYRLGDLIGDVYGWKFPNRPKQSVPDAIPA